MEVLWAIPLGLATGGLLGTLGAGGSVLTVPALVYLLGQPVGPATTASLAIVAANAAVGAAGNRRAGTIAVRLALGFGAAGIAGALVGARLNRLADGETILFLLALVMVASAVSLWRGRPEGDGRVRATGAARAVLIAALGLVVGVMTGFFGVGGGFLIVPALVLALGISMRIAVGTSLVIIAINSASGIVAHLPTGGFNVEVALVFVVGGLVGSQVGSRLAGRVNEVALARGFAALVALVGLYLIVRNGAALT